MTNKAKALKYTLFSCLAYLIIMLVLFVWKWDDYVTYADGGTKIGMFGFLVVGLCLIVFKQKIFKLIEASNVMFTFSLVGFLVSIGVKAMSEELLLIFTFSLLGSAISGIFDRVTAVYKQNSTLVINGIEQPNKAKALPDREAWARAFGINFKAEEGIVNAGTTDTGTATK